MHLHFNQLQLLHLQKVRKIGDHTLPRLVHRLRVAVGDRYRVRVLVVFDREPYSTQGLPTLMEGADHVLVGLLQIPPDLFNEQFVV